jgi:carbon-monoxide dehydrogenase large subunit
VTLRVEDARLLSGGGRFVDDVDLPGQLWARIVRSQMAHAVVREVETTEAAAAEAVTAVLTAPDLPDVVLPVRTRVIQESLEAYQQAPLARDRVRYVGEPIAVVVAADPYAAEDAAELVGVTYDELEPVLDARAASRPESPTLFEGRGNVAARLEMGYGDVDEAFARAAHVSRAELSIGPHSGVPLETRGLLAAWTDDRLEVWGTTKVPHFNRRVLASLLGRAETSIRLHGADAGGGFGVRGEFYPEDYLIPYLATKIGRPVKWIEDRSEHLVATNHSRHQAHRIEAAFDREHRLLALVDELWHDNGAYIRTHGVIVPDLTLSMLPGPYRVPAYRGTAHVVLTNRTPCGTYRGPGRYEGTFVRERLLDIAASELGVDPIDLRRQNLLAPDELPLHRGLSAIGTEMTIDAGDVPGLLERTMSEAGFDAWRAEADRLRSGGRSVGVGAAVFMEKSGLGPHEHGGVDLLSSGAIRVTAGSTSLGQGVETVLATIAAERLGVAPLDVTVVLGDTDLVPDGVGSWASRSTVVAGSAVAAAAERLATIAREAAADALEVDPADLRLVNGGLEAAGYPERRISFAELASRATEGLGARETFAVDQMTYPYGVHLAQVEVDPDSGGVRVLRYFIGYEIGRAIRRELVEGQLVGGAAQGIAGALLEEFLFDEAGQPLATTMADYLVPTASEVPPIGVLICEEWPAQSNPLGVRGAGEGGATGCGAAIAAAVDDALQRPGWVRSLPVGIERVRTRA